ncbi:VCBS repeat-containing protein [Streptomyces sp. NBC_00523]|uniref:FG-GAP repeat domain-containing protein n=1 Tax=Streptomyces sp. NBC_00523 TaxID=2975765 RepID=UPI002E82362B|nr:VCBS repeat-containing protein [Streptomyces sp. NBC_00523]WUD02070.1 VCBS repeat-containing protein [Streptomyces sp. NBC_00523]
MHLSTRKSGRTGRARSKRASRIAACTALVLSAGMLLAAPASADDAKGAEAPKAVGSTPRMDITGDGRSDILYQTREGYLFQSVGTSVADYPLELHAPEGATGHTIYKDIIAPGDLQGDGQPELLTLTASGTLTLHPMVGMDPTGGTPTWSGKGWQKYNKIVAPGDLTGDGHNDLIARTPAGDVYLYVSTGRIDGEPFEPAVKVASGWNTYDQIVGLNDSTGDGIGDVVTRTPSGDLYFHMGTGNPSKPFKAASRIGYGFDTYNQLVGVDDVNGDGYGDLMGRRPNGDTYIYRFSGLGHYRARIPGTFGWQKAAMFVGAGGNPAFGKRSVTGVTSEGAGYVYDSKNNGELFARTRGFDYTEGRLRIASSLDDGGRADDLWVRDGSLYIGYNRIGDGWNIYNDLIGPGDLSGDGAGDILARDTKGDLFLYQGNGKGTALAARIKVGYGYGSYRHIVGAGDLTGDGRADVVGIAKDGTLYLYEGTGKASAPLKARVKIGSGFDIYNKFAAIGDLNGDGRADLVGVNGYGDLYRYTSTGTGKLNKRVRIGYGFNTYKALY